MEFTKDSYIATRITEEKLEDMIAEKDRYKQELLLIQKLIDDINVVLNEALKTPLDEEVAIIVADSIAKDTALPVEPIIAK